MNKWNIPELISVGIPAYNEEKSIVRTLKTVVNQSIKIRKEIIICLNGCTDNTEYEIKKYINDLPEDVTKLNTIEILKIEKANKPKAINFIKKNASSDLIFFLDADMILHLNSFESLIEVAKKTNKNIFIISAHLKYLSTEVFVKSCYQSLRNCKYTEEIATEIIKKYPDKRLKLINIFNNITNRYSERERITGSLYFIQKNNVRDIPEEIISEDTFLYRLHNKPRKFYFDRKADAYHLPLKNLKDFFNYRSRAEAGIFQLNEMGIHDKSNIIRGIKIFKYFDINEYLAFPIFTLFIILSKINGYINYKKGKIKAGFIQQKSTKEL